MKRHKKKIIIICTVFVALGVLGGSVGGYLYNKSNDESATSLSKYSTCDDESFRKMVVDEEITLNKNTDKLRPVSEEIKKAESYENSPNCMFILTMYAINVGDRENISSYHEKLTKAYNESSGYIGSLSTANIQKPEDLAPLVEFTKNKEAVNGRAFEWDGKQPE